MVIKKIGNREELVEKKTGGKYRVSRREFMGSLIKSDERTAIYSTAKTDVVIESFLDLIRMSDYIDLRDKVLTDEGFPYLVSKGILTQERVTEILSR